MLANLEVFDALEIAQLVAARCISPVEIIDQCLRRIDDNDEEIGAFTVVFTDEAQELARQAEHAVTSGASLGPLHGVPISVKDHVWLSGQLATNGSRALADFVAPEDCACISRVRAAGAIIVGKTNNPEFCYRGYTENDLWGVTRNPRDLSRTPGGSSGGAAASVASGMVPVGIGTDGGGSIRLPASFCGAVGHKPTFGLVPKEPGFSSWVTLSVDGPITRSVRDVGLMLNVMAGVHPADSLSFPGPEIDYIPDTESDFGGALTNLRIAYSHDLGFAPVDAEVLDCFNQAIRDLGNAGAVLTEDHPATGDPTKIWNEIAVCEGYASEGHLLEQWEPQMTSGIAEILRLGQDKRAVEYIHAQRARSMYTRSWSEFFMNYDILLSPMAQVTAFSVGQKVPATVGGVPVDPFFDAWCGLCCPANLTGQPALSVPIETSTEGLPVGLQIIGRRFQDASVLRLGAAIEALLI